MIPIASPSIGLREISAVNRVLRSGRLAQGTEVAAFEEEFSQSLVDGQPVVAVNSGTSGLHLGLLAAGIGPGDEVIVPSFSFAATANSVALTGARPVFCDINPETYCMDPAIISALITPKTKAIMPVHLYGHPAEMPEIAAVAERNGLGVYEDAAQAHGASIEGRKVGTFGVFAVFSLYPTKNMTSGEGGMITFRTPNYERTARVLRNQGMERQYENELVGFNYRMTDIHAAIGRIQLKKLVRMTSQRQSNARYLTERLEGVKLPVTMTGYLHVFHQFTIRVLEDRDRFAQALRDEFGVGSGIYYPTPIHRLVSMRNFAQNSDLPETDRASRQVLSLPIHPGVTKRHLDTIVRAVNFLAKAGS